VTHRFADHFSGGAAAYAEFRPRYPDALFDWLASAARGRSLAWDCATGNGQAAVGLARHFDAVVATDASAGQVAQGEARPNVEYRVAPAEASGLADASADLVTVAQALHWLPLEPFYAEVRRVLRPGGLLAVWGYSLPTVSPSVDVLTRTLHRDIVGPYWPAGREHVEAGYRTLAFPYLEEKVPPFSLELALDRRGFEGYLRTWSAVRRFVEAQQMDPLAELLPTLLADWPADEVRIVRWPLFIRAGFQPLNREP
jgi:ubiquinone/menaquinone biosynthesis C-methylase UbiE